jgi:3',5'-cyclic AMP phosphodiesterase CpdA
MTEEGEINAMEWNGGIGKEQLEWFDAQLTEAEFSDEKVMVFCHFPIFPDNRHNLLNSKEVMQVLEKHQNVIAWFSGHNHAGNYGNKNMTHFVTMRGMVETEEKNSFATVEIYSNKIWITGYGNEKSQILAY